MVLQQMNYNNNNSITVPIYKAQNNIDIPRETI